VGGRDALCSSVERAPVGQLEQPVVVRGQAGSSRGGQELSGRDARTTGRPGEEQQDDQVLLQPVIVVESGQQCRWIGAAAH